jgi:O-antigen biosynthesis protein
MMKNKLSVIIVSYNVKYYLDQCLQSVMRACKNLPIEVWVVDNNSTDGSIEHVQQHFASVNVIANKDNKGFSKANNQAMLLSNADYYVLLNPDTVVSEDTFEKTIAFFDATPNCGGLTVKMVDGFGRFLPESKRGLPTPEVAFYKIFGLSTLLPKSIKFGQYHLGYLAENETNVIDVLSGAYMMMRKETLDKCGLLDENFFMYGEDIDLSYRITLAGYKNYYYPHTKIIHYKGESTKKSSINYVMVFYKAMIIFSEKHFTKRFNKGFTAMINIAIYLRAGLAILNRFFTLARFAFFDVLMCLILFSVVFTNNVSITSVVMASALLLFTQFIQGNYSNDKHWLSHALTNLSFNLVLTTIFNTDFALLNLIPIYVSLALFDALIFNIIVFWINPENSLLAGNYKQILVVSNDVLEFENVFSIINQDKQFIADNVQFITLQKALLLSNKQIKQCSEIVFSSTNISYTNIINTMEQWREINTEFKIYIASSKYITSTSNLYIRNKFSNVTNTLAPYQVWQKNCANFMFSILTLVLTPVLLLFNKTVLIKQALNCLLSKTVWLGVAPNTLYTPSVALIGQASNEYNTHYYKNYTVKNDILILIKLWFN